MAHIPVRKTGGTNAGTEIQVDANSGYRLRSGAYITLDNLASILGGDDSLIDIGGTGVINASNFNLSGQGHILAGGTLTVDDNGTLTTEGNATIDWVGAFGALTNMSWNVFTVMDDTGTWTHRATHNVTGASGVWNFASGGNIAGDPLFKNADVTVDNNSSWIQQCAIKLDGSTGYVAHRPNDGSTPLFENGTTVTVTQQDVWDFSLPDIDNARLTLGGVTGRHHRFHVVYTPGSAFNGYLKWNGADRVHFPPNASGTYVSLHLEANETAIRLLGVYNPDGAATCVIL